MDLAKSMQLLIVIFLSINCQSQSKLSENDNEASKWEKFNYDKLNVQLEFPNDKVKIYNDKIKIKKYGKASRTTIQWKSIENDNSFNSFYTFNYYQYPKYNFKESEMDEFYENRIQFLLKDLNGELIQRKKVEYEKNIGVEFTYSLAPFGIIITQRIFLINDLEYSLSVITRQQFQENLLILKFLNSFKLK